jgi:hypothetical protein
MPVQNPRYHILLFILTIGIPACGGDHRSSTPAVRDESLPKPSAPSGPPSFSGQQAYDYLLRITSFGPRNPNSAGHANALTYLSTTLGAFADSVRIQSFTQKGYGGEVLHLSNVIASFNPESRSRILLCTHWDTRPRADRDRDVSRWDEPILGANDGGSGSAVLLEIASILSRHRSPVGVDLVLFDGEDYGFEGDTPNYLLGSRYFAKTKPAGYAPRFGILLDMIGDAQLEIPREGHSMTYAPDIVELVWKKAGELGYTQFVDREGEPITDDHLPLNEVGIKTIDLIDFAYPDETHRYWHTHEDTPEKCSPESLEAVGTVLIHIIYDQSP